MKRHGGVILVGTALIMCAWRVLGIERIYREDSTEYHFFLKQSPRWKVMFVNPVHCGECDVAPLNRLSKKQLDQFNEYCQVRFGLTEIRPCYAIFREKQAMATERINRARGR